MPTKLLTLMFSTYVLLMGTMMMAAPLVTVVHHLSKALPS